MAHYFTREEAEALLPQISVTLHALQQEHAVMRAQEEKLNNLKERARGNGRDLQGRIQELQLEVAQHIQTLQGLIAELDVSGCVLKDPESGLIDFLSLRDGQEVYLCWLLGEERINYWHEIHSGFAGRQRL